MSVNFLEIRYLKPIRDKYCLERYTLDMTTQYFTLLKEQLFSLWWVFFFALLCFICYEQGIKIRNEQYHAFSKQLQELKNETQRALALQTELSAQIQGQNDNEWIELLLMKELGVVPEGYKKIYFIK